ncbi:hypothetical protein [Dapis sp. BLCC M229]|uniref:hypothetical protein n=1 Tax=Dapis sp. BLCC M229 TaxID=3400188 RepID=UPI003CEC4D20
MTLLSITFEDASNASPGVDEFDIGIDGINLQITNTFGTNTLRFFPEAGFLGLTDRKVDFSGGVKFNGDRTNALFPVPAKGLVFDFYTENRNGSFRIREIEIAVDVPEYMSTFSILTFATLDAISTLKRKLNLSKSIKKGLKKVS